MVVRYIGIVVAYGINPYHGDEINVSSFLKLMILMTTPNTKDEEVGYSLSGTTRNFDEMVSARQQQLHDDPL